MKPCGPSIIFLKIFDWEFSFLKVYIGRYDLRRSIYSLFLSYIFLEVHCLHVFPIISLMLQDLMVFPLSFLIFVISAFSLSPWLLIRLANVLISLDRFKNQLLSLSICPAIYLFSISLNSAVLFLFSSFCLSPS